MRAVVAGGKVKAYGRAFGSDIFVEGAILTEVAFVCIEETFVNVCWSRISISTGKGIARRACKTSSAERETDLIKQILQMEGKTRGKK